MRMTKRLIAFALAALMLVSTCVIVNAALPSTATQVKDGVSYYEYSNTGAQSGKTTTYNVLKFNVGDGLIPMAYSGDAGKTGTVADHVAAAKAEGYEVMGAINGSYFSMSYGDPCSSLISNNRLVFGTAAHEDVFTAFDINGKATLTQVTLVYTMTLDGKQIDNAIGLVNKDYTAVNDVTATISTRFHYYDSLAGAIGNTSQTGYEILCEKQNGTEIKVGDMLEGKVISVTSGYYGKTIPTNDNQFVLFVKSSSSYASNAQALSAGDRVTLYIDAWSNTSGTLVKSDWGTTVLKNAHSAICDTYWLVYDGVDQTNLYSEIGHSVTYSRPWTAFGWDDNGNYGFIATEGEVATLSDVAKEMKAMGFTNVVRLDGGGSTAMYVEGKGNVYYQPISSSPLGRMVVDTVLIIKTPANITLEQTLAEAKALYEGDYSAEANAYINAAYDKAYDVYKNPSATNAQYKQADTELKNAIAYIKNANNFAGKPKLTDFIYIDAIDEKVSTGKSVLITPNFNSGKLTATNAGYGYSYGVLAEKQSNGKYKVVARYEKYKEDITLKSNQILLMTSYQKTKPITELNKDNMLRLAIGDELTFHGMAIEYNYISAGAYISAPFSYVDDGGSTPGPDLDPEPSTFIRGDVNLNGKIDSRDYLLLKRAYFGTTDLNEIATLAADVNKNDKIDSRDYMLLKRAYFGTYTIEQ